MSTPNPFRRPESIRDSVFQPLNDAEARNILGGFAKPGETHGVCQEDGIYRSDEFKSDAHDDPTV